MASKSPLNNSPILDLQSIRKVYRNTERITMILLLISLPIFGMVYLYHNSGNLDFGLPKLEGFFNGFIIGFSVVLLIGQYVIFHQNIKLTFEKDELLDKAKIYLKATSFRFLILFATSLLSTIGLLFNQSPVYIVLFAISLVFFSLAKPSPDRMARLMKLKKADLEILREASRPE
jgi:hypothetical protein